MLDSILPFVLPVSEAVLTCVVLAGMGSLLFKRKEIPERMRWCSHCEAPLKGHYSAAKNCPVLIWSNVSKRYSIQRFFKPMTVEEWMKRQGLDL